MKHCPSCGAELPRPDVAFCPECGKSLSRVKYPAGKHKPKHIAQPMKRNPLKKKKTPSKRPRGRMALYELRRDHRARSKRSREELPYDGYYDDVLPSDGGEFRQGSDPKMVKQIALLISGVLVIVALCVVMLYLL